MSNMTILLHIHRNSKPITLEEALEKAKSLQRGDLGLISIEFDTIKEQNDFFNTHTIINRGEWRFYNKESL